MASVRLGVVPALALALAACGGGRTAAWEGTSAQQSTATAEQRAQHDQLVATGDAAFEHRDDEAQLRAAIDAWTQALAADPSDWQLWARLSRAQYFLADGHMAFDTARDAETTAMYQTAITSAERSLQVYSPEFARRMNAGERIETAVAILDRNAVPALYWRSAALGKWARRDGFATVLAYKDEIRAIMTRCLELDRAYFYAGPDRYFGAFFAVAPTYAGGDLNRSREHFEYAISQHPGYFGTHVLYAVEYAVKMQDRALFERELRLVIDGDPDTLPDVRPENLAEQRKARDALARIDELFE
jgi:tetratricopeptide (TPR) repeat protein